MTFISYAQNFEDVMLWRALKHIKKGFYIDIGAWSPDIDSVTHAFYERGWHGINVEPNPDFHQQYLYKRTEDINLQMAISDRSGSSDIYLVSNPGLSSLNKAIAESHIKLGWKVSHPLKIKLTTLQKICNDYVRNKDIHFLKIDVEGLEKKVLLSNNWINYRPWIVVIEATLPMSQIENYKDWEYILLDANYIFAYADGLNRFYVASEHQELLPAFKYPPNVYDTFILAVQHQAEIKSNVAEIKANAAEARANTAEARANIAETKANEKWQNYQIIINSHSWKFTYPFRLIGKAIRWFLKGSIAWLTFSQTSRPRRILRRLLISSKYCINANPKLKAIIMSFLKYFPKFKKKLKKIYRAYYLSYDAQALIDHNKIPKELTPRTQQIYNNLKNLQQRVLKQTKQFSWNRLVKRAIKATEHWASANPKSKYIRKSKQTTKPKLAYISPLLPKRSGISYYSAELIPHLAQFYDIEIIAAQKTISNNFAKDNCTIRTVKWFKKHANRYDRILYHFGNSSYHQHMFELLDYIPGIVVLHDFFLSGVIASMELSGYRKGYWVEALYNSHSYKAVQERFQKKNIEECIFKYPCSLRILQQALGIIAHSQNSINLAKHWYGKQNINDWAVIPHLREPVKNINRITARNVLGIPNDAFLICSFGLTGPMKLNHKLLEAFLVSKLAKEPNVYLVFVGENHNGNYGAKLISIIKQMNLVGRIKITGWANAQMYKNYLQTADMSIQLRTMSRGETSGTVLDCMNYGLATIVNAHGSMADLSRDGGVWILDDKFTDIELINALETLYSNTEQRLKLGKRAREIISAQHNPTYCAKLYADHIESFYKHPKPNLADIINASEFKKKLPSNNDNELIALASNLAKTFPNAPRKRQFCIDISELVKHDIKTGIERVARAQLLELIKSPPNGYHVEPIYLCDKEGWHYRYARRYVSRLLEIESCLPDEPIDVYSGDIIYVPDLCHHAVIQANKDGLYQKLKADGILINFLVYDLLPITNPKFFPTDTDSLHAKWLKTIIKFADLLICISCSVENEIKNWIIDNKLNYETSNIRVVYLGADIHSSYPSKGLPDYADIVLKVIQSVPSFLMVGTIEPRKGYLQVIAAFEELWQKNMDVNLVIVGREGWMELPVEERKTIPTIINKLRNHPESGKRLFWLEAISDEYLEKVYDASTCLIAASEAEGFGLPLIEAAQHKLPIIARDIPVFREVAGEYAYYFYNSTDVNVLAKAIQNWLSLFEQGKHPKSDNMPWLTWKENVAQLKAILLNNENVSSPYYRAQG